MTNLVRQMKKAAPRYSEAQKKEVVEAAKTGLGLQELLEKFPMGKRAILRYLKKFDVKLRN